MTKEMSLFGGEGNSLVSSELFDKLNDINKNLMGGGGNSMRRISIRGSRFRQIVGGEQVAVSKDSGMNVVIVNAAPIARTYYKGTYDPDKVVPPTCWSSDTKTPNADVPDEQRQSDSCMKCPQNVKGSGQGETRACRYSQRVAVVIEGQWDEVYQLQLAATSVFGDAENGNMPMGAYARYLHAHKTPSIAVVTEMYFDENSDMPKLFFKPVRPLTEEELEQCIAASESEDAKRAIEMTVAQVDGVQDVIAKDSDEDEAPPAKAKKAAPKQEPEEEEEDVPPPKKATRGKAKQPEPEENESEGDDELSSIIADWDD